MEASHIVRKNPTKNIVEASCKTLVGQRLKRAGMSLQHNGGQGVLTVRSLIKSQRYDKAWEIIAHRYRKTVTVHKVE